jgi:hypothetical protein
MIVILVVNALLGAWSVNVLLGLFDKVIPLIGAILIGLVAGEITIPLAIIVAILQAFGVL